MDDPRIPLPLFLNLVGRACLVVGGGAPLESKVDALLDAGAVVTVVADALASGLSEQAASGRIAWRREGFNPAHLDGVWLVVALPGPEVEVLHQACAERRIFLNVVDLPSHCSATWPAVVRRPPVLAAFSTMGRSPALASHLRRELERMLPADKVAGLVAWLEGWREESRRRHPDLGQRARVWEEVMALGVVGLYLGGEIATAEAVLTAAMGSPSAEE